MHVACGYAIEQGGAIYEVAPLAPVEPDPAGAVHEKAFHAPSAQIIRIHTERVTAAQWRRMRRRSIDVFVEFMLALVAEAAPMSLDEILEPLDGRRLELVAELMAHDDAGRRKMLRRIAGLALPR